MEFNIKSRKGFTLIELLVVIGILAVLAAIAIPSVAGLIDRANVSADNTNANEYTNAIERFASEYELYCQDIASGVIKDENGDGKPDNLDATQSRVYNTILTFSRDGIELIEISQDDFVEDNIVAIYRDTKYPANLYTAKAIIQNYSKTNSSSFEPKQSDVSYWYSPDCGVVVISDEKSSINTLNSLVVSGTDAKGNTLDSETHWINLTTGEVADIEILLNQSGIIPDGGTYYIGVTGTAIGDYTGATEILNAGNVFPTAKKGDVYVYGDYEYRYKEYQIYHKANTFRNLTEWGVRAINQNKTKYQPIVENINGKNVTVLTNAFKNCSNLKVAPQIPPNTKSLACTFFNCTNLSDISEVIIPSTVTDMKSTFYACISLTNEDLTSLTMPNVTFLTYTFSECTGLTDLSNFKLPNSIEDLYGTFRYCSSLVIPPELPKNVKTTHMLFEDCTSLTIAPDISKCNELTSLSSAFSGCKNLKTYIGSTDADGDFSNYKIPNSVTSLSSTFEECASLFFAPTLHNNITNLYNTFFKCENLLTAPVIPESAVNVAGVFGKCSSLTGTIIVNTNNIDIQASSEGGWTSSSTVGYCNYCFNGVDMSKITLTGSASKEILNFMGKTGKNFTEIP